MNQIKHSLAIITVLWSETFSLAISLAQFNGVFQKWFFTNSKGDFRRFRFCTMDRNRRRSAKTAIPLWRWRAFAERKTHARGEAIYQRCYIPFAGARDGRLSPPGAVWRKRFLTPDCFFLAGFFSHVRISRRDLMIISTTASSHDPRVKHTRRTHTDARVSFWYYRPVAFRLLKDDSHLRCAARGFCVCLLRIASVTKEV